MTYMLRRRGLGRSSCRAVAEMTTTGIKVYRNDAQLPQDDQLVIRWGCTSTIPQRNVLNTATAIHGVSDKIGFRRILNDEELCPKTWFTTDDFIGEEEEYPVVIRPRHHHQGRNLFVATNRTELDRTIQNEGSLANGYYISRQIFKVAEYRVFVVSGRAVAVANKTPADPSAVAWNVAQGGRFDNVRFGNWPLEAVDVAIRGFNLSGLDFGGVDVMVDDDGKAYILEINSAPSLTSPYRQSCLTKAFDYIAENGKEKIPVTEGRGWRGYIHPAISAEAI